MKNSLFKFQKPIVRKCQGICPAGTYLPLRYTQHVKRIPGRCCFCLALVKFKVDPNILGLTPSS